MQIIFAAERKFLTFALLKHNPEIYPDEFQAWLEMTRQANCVQSKPSAEPYGNWDYE